MIQKPQTIYLDESGFTGDNLSDIGQPFFTYASVALAESSASALCVEMTSRFRIGGAELKGSSLVKSKKGRDAVSWLLEKVQGNSLVIVCDKRYALAGKFFEYVFEPVLARQSSLFYAIGFHEFVAAVLYFAPQMQEADADGMLRNFESLMRTLDNRYLDAILSVLDNVDIASWLGQILVFAQCHRERIAAEINQLRGLRNEPRWYLELSASAVNYLLASWGERFRSLKVYCDESKPLQANLSSDTALFAQFIGREDKAYIPFGKAGTPSFIYNLSDPIRLVNSKDSPGVQIADVIASSATYALRNRDDAAAKDWLDFMISQGIIAKAMIPVPELLDLEQKEPFTNAAVLLELVDRSIRGDSLFTDMPEYISTVRWSFLFWPLG